MEFLSIYGMNPTHGITSRLMHCSSDLLPKPNARGAQRTILGCQDPLPLYLRAVTNSPVFLSPGLPVGPRPYVRSLIAPGPESGPDKHQKPMADYEPRNK